MEYPGVLQKYSLPDYVHYWQLLVLLQVVEIWIEYGLLS